MTDDRPAILFDIDGTLVDSNYLHVHAWSRAFEEAGHPVDAWRLHRAIGMDSSMLLDTLLGEDAAALGERASLLHTTLYKAMAEHLRPFAGARSLVTELAARGFMVVLATSAPAAELETLRGVLELDDKVAEMTSSADVGTAKPAPDIIEVALAKAGVPPERAVMVGDSVWDVKAAKRAGVECIGVLSGGVSSGELTDAGAIAIYADAADLLAGLDESPISALRG